MNDPSAWKEGWSAEGNWDLREGLQVAGFVTPGSTSAAGLALQQGSLVQEIF